MESSPKKKILLGIGGGVAAYKAVAVASSLCQMGFKVRVAMTTSAKKFVAPLSFSAITRNNPLTRMFPINDQWEQESNIYPHLYPAINSDIFVALPATADLIAKLSHGIADDIVSTSAISLPEYCLRIFCPGMNCEMWHQKIVQINVLKLENLGWQRIGPNSGHLACGMHGVGRMSEPDEIVQFIFQSVSKTKYLAGIRILILSGPTLEHIDPVRFISNHSSGKMGKALALTAFNAGAKVDFISGPVPNENLPNFPGINMVHVTSAKEMLEESKKIFSRVNVCIFAAAVADFSPSNPMKTKKKKPDNGFVLNLTNTLDISTTLCGLKNSSQTCIGFALETSDNAINQARQKLKNKSLDAIILNGIDSLGSDNGNFTFILPETNKDSIFHWGRLSKLELSHKLLEKVAELNSKKIDIYNSKQK